jgi:hypothetical protein
MQTSRLLLSGGLVLLAISALLGFVQQQHRHSPEAFAQWRVVHAGGAAGAVQLIALAAVWDQFAASGLSSFVAWGLILTSWAFFLGPLARAMSAGSAARWINLGGAIVAVPTYLMLPTLLVG